MKVYLKYVSGSRMDFLRSDVEVIISLGEVALAVALRNF